MRSDVAESEKAYERLRDKAALLAGGIADLARRASVYHHLYAHSRGNHVFPLLAAHGALWARGHFQLGTLLGHVISWRHPRSPSQRRLLMGRLAVFADAFREINRRVCIETYAIYHLTRDERLLDAAGLHIPAALIAEMQRCHAAASRSRGLSAVERRALFTAFFLWEQETIVGPAVDLAVARFNWPSMKELALRPIIRFSYLPLVSPLRFRDFSSVSERIERGMQAYDLGARAGWREVESALRRYRVLPQSFFEDSARHVAALRGTVVPI